MLRRSSPASKHHHVMVPSGAVFVPRTKGDVRRRRGEEEVASHVLEAEEKAYVGA